MNLLLWLGLAEFISKLNVQLKISFSASSKHKKIKSHVYIGLPNRISQKNYNIVHYDYKVILKLKGRKYSIIKHLDLEVYPSV